MSYMSSVTKQHNCKELSTKNVDQLWNCRNKGSCPLGGKCLKTCIAYKADVITNKDSHIYSGASDGEFKCRYDSQKFVSPSTSRARHGTLKTYLAATRKRHKLHPELEYGILCLDIQMWIKKV